MGFFSCIKLFATLLIGLLIANWILTSYLLDFKRDISKLALNQQSNTSSVRNENETAIYRNFLAPQGFPLTTGLGLSQGYKIRNGNFGDLWNAIMEVSSNNNNTLQFTNSNETFSLPQINGLVSNILNYQNGIFKSLGNVGIVTSISSLQGFTIMLASMVKTITSINSGIPSLLPSVPRKKIENLDVLVIDSSESLKLLNGSEHWYKLVIVCEDKDNENITPFENVVFWKQLSHNYSNICNFEYIVPEDNSDDKKEFLNVTSQSDKTTNFSQMNLISSVAAFIKNFPMNHELSKDDFLTILLPNEKLQNDSNLLIQMWPKLLAILLHGGSIALIKSKGGFEKNMGIPLKTTLLLTDKDIINQQLSYLSQTEKQSTRLCSLFHKIKSSWAKTLISEGIFTKCGTSPNQQIPRLRCIFLSDSLHSIENISSFKMYSLPKLTYGSYMDSFTTKQLNYMKSIFGARIVIELYCPNLVLGPIMQTNFYEYRVLPESVDNKLVCFGTLSTTLEGKLVETELSTLNINKKQGMLCIRGFTIGKPVEEERKEIARNLSKDFGGNEGWMPLVGVFGLWGQDGCFYIFK
ncbi:Dde1p NDAI_0D01700 [Naumovozyma dairenensis CBS 421]|uniref:Uncharacterized protein n=1 Tax=Naumovozyma dairenensis (strain ATCC 10597 / BCRC 20456 / CBS 421 / NBRC 0211 / NRRL Y-12639) TaxID=1071378 RepID=G0W9M3_NAUDC|nr:hypothetical protein NDAI_0D01700 [Naumovozyma dairenensis CBS 421]CCD24484.1 hypothetical protein NDAI_0D01700 [Naumovozyma dairenensis CBS 421]